REGHAAVEGQAQPGVALHQGDRLAGQVGERQALGEPVERDRAQENRGEQHRRRPSLHECASRGQKPVPVPAHFPYPVRRSRASVRLAGAGSLLLYSAPRGGPMPQAAESPQPSPTAPGTTAVPPPAPPSSGLQPGSILVWLVIAAFVVLL